MICFLQANRDEISKLSDTHKLLKRFQFVYTLPTTLNKLLQKEDYEQVILTHYMSVLKLGDTELIDVLINLLLL